MPPNRPDDDIERQLAMAITAATLSTSTKLRGTLTGSLSEDLGRMAPSEPPGLQHAVVGESRAGTHCVQASPKVYICL